MTASAGLLLALGAVALWKSARRHLMTGVAVGLLAAGTGVIWARSTLVSAGDRGPLSGTFDGRVLERIEQPAEADAAGAGDARARKGGVKVRVNVPLEADRST